MGIQTEVVMNSVWIINIDKQIKKGTLYTVQPQQSYAKTQVHTIISSFDFGFDFGMNT